MREPSPFAGGGSRRSRARVGCARVLIYSHDTFGLGHLRRSRAIANALVERAARRLGPDHLGLAGDRQLRVRQRRRLRPHAGRHQAAGRRLPQPQPQRLDRRGGRPARGASSCRPPRPSGPTSSSSTRSRPAFAARSCRRSSGCSSEAAASCSASATSWTSRRCSPPNGSARAPAEALRRYYDEIWVYGLKDIYEPLDGARPPARGRARASPTPAICAARCRRTRR